MTDTIKESIEEATDLVKDFAGDVKEEVREGKKKKPKLKMLLLILFLIGAGIGTGYFLSLRESGAVPVARDVAKEEISKGMIVGMVDEKTFRDSAEGKLVSGGLDGEGSHHLERPGGESQDVYLTSSVVDLDKFVGRKIKVWGETFTSQKAGWLMDVGKLKVLD